jgi:hypothetical protein
MRTGAPIKIEPLAPRLALEWYMFDKTWFETTIYVGTGGNNQHSAEILPGIGMPTFLDTVAESNLSISNGGSTMMVPMAALALGNGAGPLERYKDWRALAQAYNDGFQVLFARAMVDVLGTDIHKEFEKIPGQQQITTEAVLLEPVFVHIATGLLSVVSLATIVLLILSLVRKKKLRNDPSTIASVMALVAESHPLLSDLASLDCASTEDFESLIGPKRFRLVGDALHVQ